MSPAHIALSLHTTLQADRTPRHKMFTLHTHAATHVTDLHQKTHIRAESHKHERRQKDVIHAIRAVQLQRSEVFLTTKINFFEYNAKKKNHQAASSSITPLVWVISGGKNTAIKL